MKFFSFTILLSSILLSQLSHAGPIRDLLQKIGNARSDQTGYQHNYRQRHAEVSNRRFFNSNRHYRDNSRYYRAKKIRKKSNQRNVYRGSMPSSISATGRNTFVFDPRRLQWGAYNASGHLVSSGNASGGKGYCADVKRSCRTPRGTFSVYRKGSASCASSKYPLGRGGAAMPHCMFFHKGYAIHGSGHVPNHNASHGCIRVQPHDAAWLSRNFIKHGTRVIVRPY